jgi:hypothetical protein
MDGVEVVRTIEDGLEGGRMPGNESIRGGSLWIVGVQWELTRLRLWFLQDLGECFTK